MTAPGGEEKKSQVRAFFSRHAAAYATSTSHKSGADLDRLLQLLAPQRDHEALDVATATGHTALALAPRVARVVGLDLTPEMRGEFERAAAAQGVTNARFQVGDAEEIPFPAESFDLVTARRAPHHFPHARRAVTEMARVLRRGGRLGVADMSPPDDPAVVELFNALEIARDPSHVRAYTAQEWHQMVALAGLKVLALEIQVEPMPWANWLRPVAVSAPEALEAERILSAAAPEVARHVIADGPEGRVFLKRRIILVAEKE